MYQAITGAIKMQKWLLLLTLIAPLSWAQLPVFVSTEWLASHLEDDQLYLIDLSDQTQYTRFHIPGAKHVEYNWLITPQNGLVLSGGSLYMQKVLSQLGVQPDDTIIIYDDTANLNSARLFWELKKLNHKNVALLNGGTVAWVLEQRKMTQHPESFKKGFYSLPKQDLTDALTADKQEVLAAIQNSNTILLDVRSQAEYKGNPQDPRSGHIPTAVHFEWIQAVDIPRKFMERDRDTLLKQLAMIGIHNKQQPIIVYCHTGHRAARMFATLTHLGFSNVKVYDGSMQEWILDKTLPIKQGSKP
jgi:thiosulfate/3-mercaptopyruvate sulfurtransferase